jgi:hypothetical protein
MSVYGDVDGLRAESALEEADEGRLRRLSLVNSVGGQRLRPSRGGIAQRDNS